MNEKINESGKLQESAVDILKVAETMKRVDAPSSLPAPNLWYDDPQIYRVVNAAAAAGYLRRHSTTQVEWTESGIKALDTARKAARRLAETANLPPLVELYRLWDQLRDVPVTEDGVYLDGPFLHFSKGAEKEDVWHWFEAQNPRFIVGDVQQGIRVTDRKLKVRELTFAALDFAVAQCEGKRYEPSITFDGIGNEYPATLYSIDPALAWPIIDREGISIRKIVSRPYSTLDMRHFDPSKGDVVYRPDGYNRDMVRRPISPHQYEGQWLAKLPIGTGTHDRWSVEDFLSPTSLVAAMRCWVATCVGEEIEVPDHLLTD